MTPPLTKVTETRSAHMRSNALCRHCLLQRIRGLKNRDTPINTLKHLIPNPSPQKKGDLLADRRHTVEYKKSTVNTAVGISLKQTRTNSTH